MPGAGGLDAVVSDLDAEDGLILEMAEMDGSAKNSQLYPGRPS